MNEWIERYLDLATHDAVGAVLLDARAAFVASGDGAAVLWANAAGIRLFRSTDMKDLSGRRFGSQNPLREQLARLSRLLPADRSRIEALSLSLASAPALCRRINLAGGTRAVLAVVDGPAVPTSLRGRAQELAEATASGDGAVAIVAGDGRLLAASDDFEPAQMAAIAALARATPTGSRKRVMLGEAMAAEAIAFVADGDALCLVVASPQREASRLVASTEPADAPASAAAAPRSPEPAAEVVAPSVAALPTTPPVPAAIPRPAADAVLPSPIASPPQSPPPEVLPAGERLSGSEADAFRRIREMLGRSDRRVALRPANEVTAAAASPRGDAPAQEPPTPSASPSPGVPPPTIDETLLDRLAIGIVIFRDRRTLLANRTLLDLLGYGSLEAFAEAGGADTIFADGNRAWATGDFDDSEGRLAVRKRDGATLPVEARLNTVTFSGETAFMLSVTPRTAATEPPAAPRPAAANPLADIAGAERRIHDLELILNTATDGVLVVDRHGTVESMNRAAEALFAVEAGDFKGRSFTELMAEESRRAALDYLDGLAENGVASVLNDGREVIGKVPHGGLIPLFMTMGRIGDSGRFSAVVRDITHWKAVEEELTAARREAEAANNQKSEFLAKISHEIRTPLNAIIGFSEIMMEQRFGPIGNDRYRAYMNDIHVSGAHLMSLINDLLDLSKIEAGKVDLTFESIAPNVVIQECVALMQPLANRERIIIRTSLSTDLPNVVADARSFRQVLLNLMSNAIKFTRAGGQVIVSTLLEETGEVVVRIRDTGIGMSAKDIETAMKPFEQVAAAQGGDKGTGLGLPLTKAMVEANRAMFAIESAPNQGTLVRITFPTTRVLAG